MICELRETENRQKIVRVNHIQNRKKLSVGIKKKKRLLIYSAVVKEKKKRLLCQMVVYRYSTLQLPENQKEKRKRKEK